MKNKKQIKIDKKDHFRAILTDTAPSDTPIIFSNDGLYINHHKARLAAPANFNIIKSLYERIVSPIDSTKLNADEAANAQNKQSYPLKYKIIKNESSLRTLSLIHPRSQKNYCSFYSEYGNAIISLCSQSPLTIRAPVKIGGSFYSNDAAPHNKYKEINIDTIETELNRRHASSYFAYKGFNRLYKLYNSSRYFNLEQKYASMWTLDIANCFQSIYTHTISWAIKNKEFIKQNIANANQFCQKFDTLIQRSNNNETNGIPIGSEVSRIFAEIILQDADIKIISTLEKHGLKHEIDYEILRYVDDYIIFTNSNETSELVADTISDILNSYNLSISDSKKIKYKRPFLTEKSKAIIGTKVLIDDLEKTLFTKTTRKGIRQLKPNEIYSPEKLFQSFINKVKTIITDDSKGYSEVASYIISILCKRVLELLPSHTHNTNQTPEEELTLREAILIIFRIVFFFYSVNPSVPSSNNIAKTLITTDQFIKTKKSHHLEFFRTEVMSHVNKLKFHRQKNDTRNGFISLERLNIILATSEFGSNYLLQPNIFSYLERDKANITYFDIVALTYYFKNHQIYEATKDILIKIAIDRLNENFNLQQESEQAHIFLDLICCPYIATDLRIELIKKYLTTYEPSEVFTDESVSIFAAELLNNFWFVKWKNLDLVKLLERKELKPVY